MYHLSIAGQNRSITSAQLQRALSTINHPQANKHIAEIETLCARGMKYANHDFDVLSAAHRFICENAKFQPGDNVRTSHAFSSPSRRGKIQQVFITSMGSVSYFLTDGGLFVANELELLK